MTGENTLWAMPQSVEKTDGGWAIVCGQCNGCQSVIYPTPSICPHCLSQDIAKKPISSQGTLYTYTVVHAARAGWNSPYGLAYVDFPEGVRICGPLNIDDMNAIVLDSPIRITAGPLRVDETGNTWYSHRFEMVTAATPIQSGVAA